MNKNLPQTFGFFCNFTKKVNTCPRGENSANLVTLLSIQPLIMAQRMKYEKLGKVDSAQALLHHQIGMAPN
jgi:hypothetical protein